jgi:hypothetical protein
VLAVVVIAVGASFVLRGYQVASESAYSTTGAKP